MRPPKMPTDKLDPKLFGPDEWPESKKDDWQGNNVAFTCRPCGRVFIVSGRIHGGRRRCECGYSEGFIKGGRKSEGSAWIVWDDRGPMSKGRSSRAAQSRR